MSRGFHNACDTTQDVGKLLSSGPFDFIEYLEIRRHSFYRHRWDAGSREGPGEPVHCTSEKISYAPLRLVEL
jgi:hypothetical protein